MLFANKESEFYQHFRPYFQNDIELYPKLAAFIKWAGCMSTLGITARTVTHIFFIVYFISYFFHAECTYKCGALATPIRTHVIIIN